MSAAYRRQRSITKGRMTPTESKSFEKGVEGGFELDLACLAALLGEIMMSQDVRFSWLFGKGARAGVGCTSSRVGVRILPLPIDSF